MDIDFLELISPETRQQLKKSKDFNGAIKDFLYWEIFDIGEPAEIFARMEIAIEKVSFPSAEIFRAAFSAAVKEIENKELLDKIVERSE